MKMSHLWIEYWQFHAVHSNIRIGKRDSQPHKLHLLMVHRVSFSTDKRFSSPLLNEALTMIYNKKAN